MRTDPPPVDCRFSQDGDDFRLLLFQSFRFFLERELQKGGFKPASLKAGRAECPR